MGCKEHRYAFTSNNPGQIVTQSSSRDGIHSSGRLIKEQERGPVQHGSCDSELFLHTMAKRTRRIVPTVPQTERFQNFSDTSTALISTHSPDTRIELKIIFGGKPLI